MTCSSYNQADTLEQSDHICFTEQIDVLSSAYATVPLDMDPLCGQPARKHSVL